MPVLLLLLSWLLAPAQAQVHDPHGAWRSVTTEHFRLHYPVQAEPWALYAASQLDDVRARVAEEVGHHPTQVVDVVVMDPFRAPNGFAIPFLGSPRMGLFATPPSGSSALGNYRSWAEELIVHEDAHLVHLLRPSRSPVRDFLGRRLLGVGPVTLKSPFWVIEGYATVIEGRLTGLGRPNDDLRATLLRSLAQEGHLPTYAELDGSSRYMGRSYRYLVGSAFLEWLEARAGEGSLRDLWARMTAREGRSFEASFSGVFGGAPAELYGRFRAELTHAALDLERARPVDEGTLWLEVGGATGSPVVSPDGERLALVQRREGLPSRLLVYATAEDPEPAERWQERIDRLLERDPEDVAPVRPEVFPREPLHTRVRNAHPATSPRWMPDGALLFASWSRAADGWFRPDLRLWHPETGEERRVTRGADLLLAEPHPDGDWAVAVRSYWGAQQLVRVDLASGAWTPLTEASPTVVYDAPRFDPDGERFVYLRNVAGWEIVLHDLATGEEERLELPEGVLPAQPAWTPSGDLLLTLGRDGFLEVHRLSLETGDLLQLTHSRGGATAAAPTPDGEALFYLSMDHRGRHVHRLALADARPAEAMPALDLPVVRPAPPPPVEPPTPAEVSPRPYGLGPLEWAPLAGGAFGPSQGSLELGVRLGDPVGRHQLLLLGGWRQGEAQGFAGGGLSWAWRRLPVDLLLRAYAVEEHATVTHRRVGAALGGTARRAWATGGLEVDSGLLLDLPFLEDPTAPRGLAYLGGRADHVLARGPLRLGLSLDGRGQAGLSGDTPFLLGRGTAEARVGLRATSIGVKGGLARGTATDPLGRLDLGGFSSTLVPDPWLDARGKVPVVPVGAFTGEAHDTVGASLRWQVVDAFVERHRMGEACTGLACTPVAALTHVGLRLDLETPAAPLAKLPALEVGAGLSCILEDPSAGWSDAPCARLSDYGAWLDLTWRP